MCTSPQPYISLEVQPRRHLAILHRNYSQSPFITALTSTIQVMIELDDVIYTILIIGSAYFGSRCDQFRA